MKVDPGGSDPSSSDQRHPYHDTHPDSPPVSLPTSDFDSRLRMTAAAKRRGLLVLLVSTFFAWGGFFMVIPMISVHFVDGLGWTAGAVGLVLAARQFFQQGLTPFSGVLADRFGAKPLIAIGMLVRAVGFAAMAFAGTYALLMAAAIVCGRRWRAL